MKRGFKGEITQTRRGEPDVPSPALHLPLPFLAAQHVTLLMQLELSDGFPQLRDPQKVPTCDEDVLTYPRKPRRGNFIQ